MTLNLHGYHPMGEPKRWYEDRKGQITLAPADIYFFTWDELVRGNTRRLDRLAEDISRMGPDIVFLQEVAAGTPDGYKDERSFAEDIPEDHPRKNTAFRLAARLNRDYMVTTSCRGNWGWITTPTHFHDRRVVCLENSLPRIVFDFGANPYPNSILIEGYAMLYRPAWKLRKSGTWRIKYNDAGDEFVTQYAVFGKNSESDRWFLAVNVHAGHKLAHIEQAMALRRHILRFVANHGGAFGGTVIAGDFNASLYRPACPEEFSEPVTAVWEVRVEGQFELDAENPEWHKFLREIARWDHRQDYKPWAGANASDVAQQRIDALARRFCEWRRECSAAGFDSILKETLWHANQSGICRPEPGAPHSTCRYPQRIDHIFVDSHFAVKNAFVVYGNASWTNLDSVSDHPAIMGVYEWQ